MNLDGFLELVGGGDKAGSGFMARCPAHNDSSKSLSVGEGEGGRILVKCFAGCKTEDVVAAVGRTMRDLSPEGRGVGAPSNNRATAQSAGLNLDDYARAKKLPVPFLQSLGVEDAKSYTPPAISISYLSVDGRVAATRYRISLGGPDKFRWKKGTKPIPYGLWRLNEARAAKRLILVEGESDCQTLWLHGFPALGLPGAGMWRKEYAELLGDIDAIYVVIEPDRGGQTLFASLKPSAIADRLRVVTMDGVKDVSELHLLDADSFADSFELALTESVPLSILLQREAEELRRDAMAHCKDLAGSANILARFADDLAQWGVAGEVSNSKLLFLATVSRLLQKPISIVVKGPSSGGKSFLVESVLAFFPDSAYVTRTAMSERALIYSEEELSHRMFVLFEAAGSMGETATYVMRSLLSEGCIKYETVEATKDGIRPRVIEREGPTGLIVTTTAVSLHAENETRLISLTVKDTGEQTREVFRRIAVPSPTVPDYSEWHALQVWLENGERGVDIPFASALSEMVSVRAVRMRRDFSKVLSLIKTHALLHQATRGRCPKGQTIATLEDYEAIRALIGELLAEGVEASVPQEVRETVEAIASFDGDVPVTAKMVAAKLKLDTSTATRRIRRGIERGYIKNDEERKGKPLKLSVAEAMPDGVKVLPTVGELEAAANGCTVARLFGGDPPPPPSDDDDPFEEIVV